ncbi:MAG: (4Fe-4S)-binding protein [Bacteroidia bacterium]|nr:(4Fe-4S)-binding protein [Bacteroidia bacterium]
MSNKNYREYSNGEITVFWKPDACIHSTVCFMKLRKVFDPSKRPWVNMQGAPTQAITDIVEQCPTDALTWKWNLDLTASEKDELINLPDGDEVVPAPVTEITIIENGPALIKGKFSVRKSSGEMMQTAGQIALCRCGSSRNKPFCDGSHHRSGFTG